MTTDASRPSPPAFDHQPAEARVADARLEPDSTRSRLGRPVVLSVLLGIALPLAAICAKELCADALFDPAPTELHIALLLLVPLHHILLVAIHPSKHRRLQLDLLGAVTIGVALVYSVLFAPILPIALLATLAGLGFLPLAPFGALVAGLVSQRRIYRNAPVAAGLRWYTRPWVRSSLGVALGVISLLGAELPSLVTEHGLVMAGGTDPARAAAGVRLLRRWGDLEVMLEATDDWGRRRPRLLLQALAPSHVSPAQARQTYFRVTGESAEAVGMRDKAARERLARWDPNRGSSRIGAVNAELELVASRLDGSVNAEAALGYAEWTMVFRNNAASEQAEARARVALPPGAVVSRVTLWIDGEPREAAFGGSGQTRQAYQNVVRVRQDPLLVTVAGPDLVQVQCFPIPPAGKEMKILVGITFPLELDRLDRGTFTVPRLVARNFTVSRALEHRVWLESKQPLSMAGQKVAHNAKGSFVLDATMDGALRGELPPAVVARRSESRYVWIEDPRTSGKGAAQATAETALEAAPEAAVEPPSPTAPVSSAPVGLSAFKSSVSERSAAPDEAHWIIEQQWAEVTPPRPERLAIVVDTSSTMGRAIEAVAEALPSLNPVPELRLLLATDDGYTEARQGKARDFAVLQGMLRQVRPLGGVDSRAALVEAATWVRGAARGVVLWVHAPQPVALGSLESLQQSFERSSVRLVAAQALPGEHVGLAELGVPTGLEVLPRYGTLKDDLRRQFSQWSGAGSQWVAARVRRAVAELPASPPSSGHLGRLWARSEVERTRSADRGAAQALAVAYRLVTPVSGAVVLENAAQYDAAELAPGRGLAGSPSVPEPETWAMLALALGFILWQFRQLRQRRVAWRLA